MKQTVFPPLDREEELIRLASVMKNSQGAGFQVLNLIGAQAEGLLGMLPEGVKGQLERATVSALEYAFDAAKRSRGGKIPDGSDWLTRAVTLGTGAAGGFGGFGTALAELPVTTTVILRAIQAIADEHGFDPELPEVRAACLAVFASAGPLEDDDGTDLSFLTMRMTLTGKSISGMIGSVAPKLAVPLGQKVAAQAVPVIGAAAGAAINYMFTGYYQDMARVQFGLMRLSADTGESVEALTLQLRSKLV